MQRKISLLLLACCLMIVFIGCSKDTPNETSSYEKGIEALHVEELPEAKKHFETTVNDEDKDQEQAKEYLNYIDTAEDMQDALSEEDYDQAIEIYTSIKDDEKFSSIQFMLSDDQDELEKVMSQRGKIAGKLSLLKDLTKENQADEFIKKQLNELLDNEYLSANQKQNIKELQNNEDTENNEDENQTAEEDEQKEETTVNETSSDNEEENNANTDENHNENDDNENKQEEADKSKSESDLSEEEAESLVYDFVKDNEVVDLDLLEENVVVLNMDHETEDGDYVFQLYEVKDDGHGGHTATYGWYEIDVETKEIEEII